MNSMKEFGLKQKTPDETATERMARVLKQVPRGRVCTYGLIAAAAGCPRGARMVARLLHSSSESQGLPWWRIINRLGLIALTGTGWHQQKALLEAEGIPVSAQGQINLNHYLWTPPFC